MKILILGVNGFIGNNLVKAILDRTDWDVFGMDLGDHKLAHSINDKRFRFVEGDITINKEWIEYHIKKCDVVLPLVAIATPMTYVKDPIKVFELDFEANLNIIRKCVKYNKRVIFPSTSEVYGMSNEKSFSEDSTNFVLGPINKERWIYSCSKQLLDRVIWAYGKRKMLSFSIFRPFNWIGPKLDDIYAAKEGSSRVVTQFIVDIVNNKPINLVDGGSQKRCFTYIDDGIDCLMKIIENPKNICEGEIFNIGNPNNECSIKDLAYYLRDIYSKLTNNSNGKTQIIEIMHEKYYGENYQDILSRKPDIEKAERLLKWHPNIDLNSSLEKTFSAFLAEQKDKKK